VVNRTYYTYIVFGVGVLLIVAGIMKLPGGIVTGIALAIFGLALFGLSFVPRVEAPADAPPPMSFFEKLSGIFFEPSRVFQNLRAHPNWLVALIIISVLTWAYTTAFTMRLTPERIVSFTNDKLVEKGWIPADKAEEIKTQQVEQAKSPARVAGSSITTFVVMFVWMAVLAAVCMLGVLLFGGRIGFWQSLSVMIWASLPPVIIGNVLNLVLLYIKDPDDIHPILGQSGLVTDNLGALVKPASSPVLFAILTAFGVLTFYLMWLRATGLRNGGERISSTSAWSIAIAFWVIGLVTAVASSALFGNFIS
jgi:ABC-type multidrug transport system fused ATPase/permease subunit